MRKLAAFVATVFLSLLGSGCTANDLRSRFVMAEQLWSENKHAAAVVEFERIVARDPKGELGLQALYRAATTQLLFLDQPNEAVRKFLEYVELTPDPARAREARRQAIEILLFRLERYPEALGQIQRLRSDLPADHPDHVGLLFLASKAHLHRWEFDEALGGYREIIRRAPGSKWSEEAEYEIGMTYLVRGERGEAGSGEGLKTAIETFEKFISDHPQSPRIAEARFGIASAWEELDHLDRAYALYEELLKTYPSPRVIRVKLARIKERQMQRNR